MRTNNTVGLNFRENQMLEFIKGYMLKNGITPTMREIADGLHFKSTSSAHRYFSRLALKGYIEQRDKSNSYKVKGIKYVESDV